MTCVLKTGPRDLARRLRAPKALWSLAAFALCLACAGQWRETGLNRPAAADPLAVAASAGAAGELQLNDGPWGPGTAVLGEKYLSALGQTCRRADFTTPTGQRRDLAVCQERPGRWATAPDIFLPAAGRLF